MKTLVVLAALAAVAVAGPTSRGDTDFDITKEKRSPSLGSLHHHLAGQGHILPVHQTYVQPIIPRHLGLKKPLIVHQPYGHHSFRSEEEQVETHSAEAKESKKTCMKEIETKCGEDVIAKSSELVGATKIEDIDGNVSDTEVEQSLRMAKEAVDTLQKKLQLAEKNPRMLKWHHGESQADGNMHENVETAKLALEHMERSFGDLESMNVHARTFSNAGVHAANLKLESARSSDGDKLESTENDALKNEAEFKSEEERLAQWKDAIENIQKNVELVRNIEDSFQHKELSGKSAAFEKSPSLKHEISNDHQQGAIELKEENTSDKRTSDMKIAQDMEKKSIDGKSSWQAREHEKSIGSKSEMETSASTLSETKSTLHSANEQKSFRSESSHLEKNSDAESGSNTKLKAENARQAGQGKVIIKPKELISHPSLKSSENLEMEQAGDELVAPIVDSTTLMKSTEHEQAEQHEENQRHSSIGISSHKEHDMSSHLPQHKTSAEHHQVEHSSPMGHDMSSHHDHQKSSSSALQAQEALDTSFGHSSTKENDMSSQLHQHKMSAENQQVEHSSHIGHDMSSHHDHQKSSSSTLQAKEALDKSFGHSFHKENDMNSQFHQHKMSAEHQQVEHSSHIGHDMSSHHDHQKSSSSSLQAKEALDKSLNLELAKATESKPLDHESSVSAVHGKGANAWAMKSSDQLTGQSQSVGVAVKPVELGVSGLHSEKLHQTLSHSTHGKSAENGALFAATEMNSGFKEALVPTKAWKASHGSARGAYGSGAALAGLGGSYSSGSGSGAVGVFPSAHVGGCAIPLLLSCSPKVVAGHLAKSHSYGAPSYGASAYRASESLSQHSKRDITKTSRPSIIKRTPTNTGLIQKNILIADKL